MPEIGETLREARMRAKLDVSEVEAQTKIRAKYLRALENEEWGLLPGSTFVRSFLRTYADYLGLDSKLLIEEYRVRHEGPSDMDLAPITPSLAGDRRVLRPPRLSRGWVIGLSALGLLVLLIILGSIGGSKPNDSGGVVNQTKTGGGPRRAAPAPATPPKPTTVRLALIPADEVYVCLIDANGKRTIDGQIVAPGDNLGPFRGRRFRLLLGHGPQQLRVNGRLVRVPASSDPIGYDVRPTGARELPQARLPSCSQ